MTRKHGQNIRQIVFEYLDRHPDSLAKEVLENLQKRGISVSFKTVQNYKTDWKKSNKPASVVIERTKAVLKPKQKKVFWTDEEKERLAKKTAQLRLENANLTLTQCFNKAQEVELSNDRRRSGPIASFGWVEPAVDIHLKNALALIEQGRNAKEISRDAEIRIQRMQEEMELMSSLVKEDALQNTPLSELAKIVVSKLVDNSNKTNKLLEKLCERFKDIQNTETKPLSNGFNKPNNLIPRFDKFHIVIYGPKKEQENTIRKACRLNDRNVNLTCFFGNEVGRTVPPSADVVIIWTRFASHAMTAKIKQSVPSNKIFLIPANEGMSRLVEFIKTRLEWITIPN